jgi:ACS family D-galactonate transporter-like MFS transporter
MTQSKNYKWIVVGLLWVVALLNYLDRQMLSTLKPVMQIDIAELQTAENFGRLMAIFLWIYGFMSPIAGLIADKTNKKWLIVISLFIWSGVTLIMGYAQTFDQLYWLRAIMGVSEAFYIPAGLSLIADFHTSKTRSLAVGVHLSGLYVGQALGGFGATIAQQFSWNGTFLFFGLVGMIYSFVLVFFLDVPKKEVITPTSSQSARASVPIFQVFSILLSNVSFWIILLIFTVPSLPGWGVKNWLPTLYSESLGIEMAKAGPIATITNAMSSLVGVIIGGIISDKWLEKNMRGRVFVSALGLGLTIPALFLIAYGSSLFHIVLATFCFGFGFGMFDTNNMPILCQFVDSKYRSTAYGTMNLMGISAGAIVTTFLGKSVDDGNLKQDFAMMALVVLGALIIQLLFLRPKVKNYSDAA